MKTLIEKLADKLTEKGHTFTLGQLEYVLNCDHELTNGKTFNQLGMASSYLPEMVETFLKLRNLNKFESYFNQL